jgi:hypothetical protein
MKRFIWLNFGLTWNYLYSIDTLKKTHLTMYKGVPQKYGYSKLNEILRITL